MFMIDPNIKSYYAVLGVSPEATGDEIRAVKTKLVEQQRAIQNASADPAVAKACEERVSQINEAANALVSPAQREKYDRENPLVRYLIIHSAAVPFYTKKADRLIVLHRAIRRFLAAKEVDLPPLTEVESEGFASDWTPVRLLDDILNELN